MKDIVVGDCVILNSGGPKMTVTEVNGDFVTVHWTTQPGYTHASFPIACVQKVPPDLSEGVSDDAAGSVSAGWHKIIDGISTPGVIDGGADADNAKLNCGGVRP